MNPAFENSGQALGLEIWRIENFEPVAYPKRDYGKFFTGDSYIILNTKGAKNKVTSWDVHFWLGLETTSDESGAAAIYTVQLDDHLNGAPVQHREVQNHESQLFLSYFKNGVRYQTGGIESGFTQVEINATGDKRLFQVKGKKNVRVTQVELSIKSMNQGDCFILDDGHGIYVYVGPTSKRIERIKAISAANDIRDQDHSGRATVNIVDDYSSTEDFKEFFQILGSGSRDEVPADGEDDDESFENNDVKKVVLYHVCDESGSLEVNQVSEKPLKQEMLDTNDCFILDTGSGIYVWIGKGATSDEKKQSMKLAQEFISSKNYPSWTQVHRITEGSETTPFKQYFSAWRDFGSTQSQARLIRAANDNDSETSNDEEFDPSIFHALKKSGGSALGFMPDDGEGDVVEIWRIKDLDISPVKKDKYGILFGGDSYVVKYEYRNKRGGQGTILYYWQGKHSSYHEKAASAMHVVKLDNEMDGTAVQVRVTQGHEPRHFLKIFKGQLIIFDGGRTSTFKNVHDHGTYNSDGIRMFHVRGTCTGDVRAVQLAESASSLASDDVFIVETPSKTYLWNGCGASDFEKEMANVIVERVSPDSDLEVIEEGSEPAEFWDALGGEADYDKEVDPPGTPFLDPRLFHCRIVNGSKFKVEEISHFEQEDLDQDDIMVLDGGDEIYIWEGQGATEEEKEKSIAMANQYIRTDPSDRSEDTVTIIRMRQYKEPRSFKRLFPSWDENLWEVRS